MNVTMSMRANANTISIFNITLTMSYHVVLLEVINFHFLILVGFTQILSVSV